MKVIKCECCGGISVWADATMRLRYTTLCVDCMPEWDYLQLLDKLRYYKGLPSVAYNKLFAVRGKVA